MTEFNKLCRACLTTISSLKYILFENVSPDVFWFCTSIEVEVFKIKRKSYYFFINN